MSNDNKRSPLRLIVVTLTLIYGIYRFDYVSLILALLLFIPMGFYLREDILLTKKRNKDFKRYRKFVFTYKFTNRPLKGLCNSPIVEFIVFKFRNKKFLQIYENGYGLGCYEFDIDEIGYTNAYTKAMKIVEASFNEYLAVLIDFDDLKAEMDYALQINVIADSIINLTNDKLDSATIERLRNDIKICLSHFPTIKSELVNSISLFVVKQSDAVIDDNEARKITINVMGKEYMNLVKCAVPCVKYYYELSILLFEQYIESITELNEKFTENLGYSLKWATSHKYLVDKEFMVYKEFLTFWTESKKSLCVSDDIKRAIDDKINDISNRYKVYEEQKAILENELRLKYPRSRLYKQK